MPRTTTTLHADTLSIEGGLFTAEWLAKVASQQAPVQADEDYRVRAGFNVREEIGLAWRSAQSLWNQFDQSRALAGHDAWGVTQRFAAELLRQCFAFQLTQSTEPLLVAEQRYPVTFTAVGGRVPVVISPHDEPKPLDTAHEKLGDNAGERIRRRSAFGLLQESLNAVPDALWGLSTNGLQLRIARDNASLTRPAWVEVDLERLFEEERYADFSVLWLLLHASRFGNESAGAADCALEQWRNACREHGTRARETLRVGVEHALMALGQGFVGHPSNTALREALASGALTPQDYLRELLRLVYRQIFLLTVEEREILHIEGADPVAVALYAEGYSLKRLRERAVRRSAHDRHGDLWQGLKQVWQGLANGQPLLALPALGGLFEAIQCPTLDACKLENRHLLLALFHLAWLREEGNAPLTRVNWRDMGPEELGSIYESLLELVPQLSHEHRQFSFQTGAATRGNARRTTGSYYTPDSLVQELLDSALEPVVATRLAAHPVGDAAVQALLSISVVDPACGSGHFLLAAARRIAGHLARVRAQTRDAQSGHGGQPTPDDYRHALRDVVTHCVYGVDMNPMALELARMALWLEAYTPDAPLGFIDHHFRLGNALLGVMDPKILLDGVPDDAYKALTGDDTALCRDLKRRNKQEREGLLRMRAAASFSRSLETMDLASTAAPLAQLDALPDATLAEIAAKRQVWEELQKSEVEDGLTLALHLYCAAYLLPKNGALSISTAPTTQDVMNALLGQSVALHKREAAHQLARRAPLLHWRHGFAQVFARGGFTLVIGNPPWERMKLQEEEWFAAIAPEVASARNKADRERAIQALAQHEIGTPERRIYDDFVAAKQLAEAGSLFCHGPRYPLTGTGDVNTYALFAETMLNVTDALGRSGFIVPTGLVTDDSTKGFFDDVVANNRLVSVFSFENEEFVFPGVHHSYRFCLMTLCGAGSRSDVADFMFYARQAEHLRDQRRSFRLSKLDIELLNPNSKTCPTFRSEADALLTKAIYRRIPIFLNDSTIPQEGEWDISFLTMLHMSGASEEFQQAEAALSLPLYEAKMIEQYDHRAGSYATRGDDRGFRVLPSPSIEQYVDPTYVVKPFYWVKSSTVQERMADRWPHKWFISFKDVTSAVAYRTLISAVIPYSAVGHTLPLILPKSCSVSLIPCLLGNLNSMVVDYVARQKIGYIHMTYGYMKQLPILRPNTYDEKLRMEIVPRVLELTYTANDLESFYGEVVAEDPALDPRGRNERGQPWRWDPDRRALLRAELDAIYAQLYGLTREDLRYILDPADVMEIDYPTETFRVLKDKETRQFGEYRTRRLVLEAWDRMGF